MISRRVKSGGGGGENSKDDSFWQNVFMARALGIGVVLIFYDVGIVHILWYTCIESQTLGWTEQESRVRCHFEATG